MKWCESTKSTNAELLNSTMTFPGSLMKASDVNSPFYFLENRIFSTTAIFSHSVPFE